MGAPASAEHAKPTGPTGWRKWLYRLLAMTLVPALFLVCLELLLRLCGYGYSPHFFLPRQVGGQPAFVENVDFGRRFFAPELLRFLDPMVLPATKPAGTYRIFILGESAAQGYPDFSFHFGRILEAMLHDRYPGTRFEVVNTAITAINSHVILPIARDCAEHDPDLFVIYMGNNEVVGPYGASGVLGPFSPSLPLIRASVGVKATRTGQLLADLMRLASPAGQSPRSWKGMSMFVGGKVPADDPRLAAVYSHFEANLQDICAVGRQAGAKVLVCTVASNLKDSAPFASVQAPDLTSADATAWKTNYEDGIARESARDHVAAVDCYRRAAALDGKVADLHFRLGRCLAALEKHGEAHDHFVLARDLDALRFRPHTRINDGIRATAGGREDEGLYLADVERAFANASVGGSPGEELFYEHVHLTFEGNYRLAHTALEQIVRILPDWVRQHGAATTPFLSVQECKDRLAFTDWNRKKGLSFIATLASQPPFTNQLDHADRLERWRRQLDELRQRLAPPAGLQEAVTAYRRALERNPGDFCLHKDFVMLLWEQGSQDEAFEHLHAALKQVPHDLLLHIQLGEMLWMQGKLEQALASCAESLTQRPDEPKLNNLMGKLLVTAGKPDQASAFFTRALQFNPEEPSLHTNLGEALAQLGQFDRAVAEYNEALRLEPNSFRPHFLLARLLCNMGSVDKGLHHYREALRIDPKQPQIHFELATVLANQGSADEAATHLEDALRLKPSWPEAAQLLHKLRARMKQLEH